LYCTLPLFIYHPVIRRFLLLLDCIVNIYCACYPICSHLFLVVTYCWLLDYCICGYGYLGSLHTHALIDQLDSSVYLHLPVPVFIVCVVGLTHPSSMPLFTLYSTIALVIYNVVIWTGCIHYLPTLVGIYSTRLLLVCSCSVDVCCHCRTFNPLLLCDIVTPQCPRPPSFAL